jgi:hypothetical protein
MVVTAVIFNSDDICPTSLSWWTSHYAKIGVAIGGSVVVAHLLAGAIITFQLMSTIDVEAEERIAASRVVYAMVINMAIMVRWTLIVMVFC